jgi:hypothetical protein
MLNRSGLSNFPFARVMDELGYLDCYVLVTLFHQDVYGQFADLVKNQPEKIKKYFYLIMNWDDKKFDKLSGKVAKLKSTPKSNSNERKKIETKKEAEK